MNQEAKLRELVVALKEAARAYEWGRVALLVESLDKLVHETAYDVKNGWY